MKLDRAYDIVSVLTAIFIVLPFALDVMVADIPDWGWHVMTVLVFSSMAAWVVLFFARKWRDAPKRYKDPDKPWKR